MKTMILYIACDGLEFTDEEKCRAHEAEVTELIHEAMNVYTFYDHNKNIILPKFNDIEEYLDWFDATVDDCEYIKVEKNISHELHRFLVDHVSVWTIPKEAGFYKYDWNKCDWVSAD